MNLGTFFLVQPLLPVGFPFYQLPVNSLRTEIPPWPFKLASFNDLAHTYIRPIPRLSSTTAMYARKWKINPDMPLIKNKTTVHTVTLDMPNFIRLKHSHFTINEEGPNNGSTWPIVIVYKLYRLDWCISLKTGLSLYNFGLYRGASICVHWLRE